MPFNNNFHKITKIESTNANTSSNSSLENLILGPDKGFSTTPPFECLSWESWRTIASNSRTINYFQQYPSPIVIDLHLEEEKILMPSVFGLVGKIQVSQ